MTSPGRRAVQVTANGLRFAYLEHGPDDGPLALCLHGFPDVAWTWRHLLPALAEAGYRAVAPWMRGYAPTTIPRDGRYDLPTLGDDANGLHEALGGDGRAVVIGHDWGALAGYRAVSAAPDRWRSVVGLAIPPEPALVPLFTDPSQMRRSWYVAAFQLPGAERLVRARDLAFVERLWSAWSPGYDVDPDHLARVKATLRAPGSLRAALGYYRALPMHGVRTRRSFRSGSAPERPTLYLHGEEDGCVDVRFAASAREVLDPGRDRIEVVGGAGHFLHLERPDETNARVLAWLASL